MTTSAHPEEAPSLSRRRLEGPTIPEIAAREFRARQNAAHRAVAEGRWTRAEAESRLRPWLAIACLAGADLPELAPLLADLRDPARVIAGTFNPPGEAEARTLVASDLCSPQAWGAELAKARDAAIEAHPVADPDHRATSLCRLARALQVPLPSITAALIAATWCAILAPALTGAFLR